MDNDVTSAQSPEREAVEHLRRSLNQGRHWPTALLEAMALWTTPQETYKGRQYTYFIGGEAFDWLTARRAPISGSRWPHSPGGTLKKCVNSQAVYPLSEQHGLEAQERR